MNKADVAELLEAAGENFDMDKFIYALWLRRKIEIAMQASEDDDMDHEDFKRVVEEWLKESGQ